MLTQSAASLAALIRSGKASAEEVVRAHLERIAEVNPALNAVVLLCAEEALAAARRADATPMDERGPLHGVPFTVKDSIETRGTRCTGGTLGRQDAAPSARDATLVARLRRAGAILLGKTNLPDLLFSFESDNLLFGRTNNPYDLARTAGGSSGGEAALIAAGGSPLGLGSDAAGSVRLPCHFSGIAGLKPTSGRLPRSGHWPAAGGWFESLWQIGPMARRLEDLQLVMPLLVAPDGEDWTHVPMPWSEAGDLRQVRVAWHVDNGVVPASPETAAIVVACARALQDRGVQVEERRPPALPESFDLEMGLLGADGGVSLRAFLQAVGTARTHPLLEGWLAIQEPYAMDTAAFARWWGRLDGYRHWMHRFFANVDAILCPVYPEPALPHGASVDPERFRGFSYTMAYNVAGLPAAVVRCGSSAEGLPIGVQVVAAKWREEVALSVARELEQVFGGWQPVP